jgi:hypothetical protein
MSDGRYENMPAVVREKGGRFFFYQPDLAVIASDTSLEGAYKRFLETKREYLAEIEQSGVSLVLPTAQAAVAGDMSVRHDIGSELKLFLMKTAIVLLLIVAIGGLGVAGIAGAVDRLGATIAAVVGPLGSVSILDVESKAAVIVKDVQAMPAERKESLKKSIGTLSREIDPLVDAWRNPPPASVPTTPAR